MNSLKLTLIDILLIGTYQHIHVSRASKRHMYYDACLYFWQRKVILPPGIYVVVQFATAKYDPDMLNLIMHAF